MILLCGRFFNGLRVGDSTSLMYCNYYLPMYVGEYGTPGYAALPYGGVSAPPYGGVSASPYGGVTPPDICGTRY